MTLRTKIILLGIGTATAVGLVVGVANARRETQVTERHLAAFEASLREGFDRNAKLQVQTAISMLGAVATRADRGEITQQEARKLGADLLRALRYDGDNYFWADTYEGLNVVLLGRPIEGHSRIDQTDPTGFPLVRKILEAGRRAGGGFTDYRFPHAEGGAPAPKRAYSLAFEPFGWVVGSGNYVDDIDALVQAERAQAEREQREDLLAIALLTLVAGALAAGLAVWLSRSVTRPLAHVVEEARRLTAAPAAGKLDVRGDVAAVDPEFRPIVAGMNETVEAFSRPVAVAVDQLAQLARGQIPPPITVQYQGDFERMKDALNRCSASVGALVEDTRRLAAAGAEGKLSTRADASRHEGDFRAIVEGINATLDAVVGPLEAASRCVEAIAQGAIPAAVTEPWRGDFDLLKRNLNTCIGAVNALVADATLLARAAAEGKLSTRADASRHQGDFRAIVQDVNATLDAVIGPLDVAAGCVEQISRGQLPPPVTQAWAGDFVKLRESVNGCIGAVQRLVTDADGLLQAAVAGRLDSRADASRHQGEFRKVVEGVNRTLDAVLAPVKEAAGVLERLARRDLRARVEGQFQGDHARIPQAANATAEALHDALSQVASAVEQVSGAAAQIAASSQAVASGASEQASSLEETGASLESVASMSHQSADQAQQAHALATAARGAASEGAVAVEQLQGAMDRIRASAEGSSQIIKDVSDIAFQTNLLALNAAIEAARAGDAGRGFAVVAEEVRSLALRAKEAAAKTEELIRGSVRQVAEGEGAAVRVAGKLGDIVRGVSKVSDIVTEIAAAAKEQASGLHQVSGAIGEMDKVTQQNAASAEESSSAASELSGQSEELAAMIGTFQLARGTAALPARRPTPHRGTALPAAPPSPVLAPAPRPQPAVDPFPMDDDTKVQDF